MLTGICCRAQTKVENCGDRYNNNNNFGFFRTVTHSAVSVYSGTSSNPFNSAGLQWDYQLQGKVDGESADSEDEL